MPQHLRMWETFPTSIFWIYGSHILLLHNLLESNEEQTTCPWKASAFSTTVMERRNIILTALQARHNYFHIKLKKLNRYTATKNLPIPNTHIQYEITKFLKLEWRLRFISATLKTVISLWSTTFLILQFCLCIYWSWAKIVFLLCPYFQINFNEWYLSNVFMWCENCGRCTLQCWLPFRKYLNFDQQSNWNILPCKIKRLFYTYLVIKMVAFVSLVRDSCS